MKAVIRYKATVKRGHLHEFVAILKEIAKNADSPMRVYHGLIGNNDVATWDFELDDINQIGPIYEQVVTAAFQNSLHPKWYELTTAVENEVLYVAE
ncbi:MAG: hypothetical protein KDE56_09320 [Anaerolineales bacterium]|nr:hypothetical protein [Anaerolineales bacterium]